MKTNFLILFFILLNISLYSQVKIGNNPSVIHSNSILELESTDKVLVISRMSGAQMSAIVPIRGALVYNTTPDTTSISVSNPTVLVLDFSSDKAASGGDFTIVFPTADASNAIIRIA